MEMSADQWSCVIYPFVDWEREREIQAAALVFFRQSACAPEIGVFSRWHHPAKGNSTYWFSPAAAVLGQRYGARPCEKPLLKHINLLINSDGMRVILFPGEREGDWSGAATRQSR